MASLLERCAWHESGHAVVARVLKLPAGQASIRADGTGHAAVAAVHSLLWDFHLRGDVMSSVLDKICVSFSGPVAEDIKFGGADDLGDGRQIENLAERYFISTGDIALARVRARKLVILHWQKIELVAAALLARKNLTGSEIDDIIILSEV